MVSAARDRSGAPARPDARRNRDRVLDAADALFTAVGTTAPTGQVAARAGVGVGTVYRHFPTKAALLEAVVGRRLERLAADAERLARAIDPAAAFDRFFRSAGLRAATGQVLAEAFTGEGDDDQGTRARFARALGVLLARAQEAGAVRPDVGVGDVLGLLAAAGAAGYGDDDTDAADRLLDVMLQGLRPPAQSPPPA